MQFESKIKRQYWINSILGLIPDLAIAGVITSVIGGAIGTFILALVALQVVYFLVWLRKTIWVWIVFGVYGRQHIAAYLTDYLVENDFPEPGIYEGSAEEYFNRLAADEALPVTVRLKAIGQAVALRMPLTIGQYQYGFRVAMAYEDALIAYKRVLAGRGRDKNSEQQTSETIGRRDSTADEDALRELNMHCEYHLLHIANFDDEYWKKADQERDLRAVVVAYFAAIDGTQDAMNTMFQPYEERAKPSNGFGIFERIKSRKLKHLMQLRTYFEFKLKLQLLDQEGREKMEPQIREMLRPELAEQVV